MGAPRLHDEFGLEGATILDRYVITAVVAAGGFGVVYRSRHARLGSDVAIKVLKVPAHFSDDARAEFIRMFLQEAQIIASLRHPAVVRVLDFGAVRTASGDEAPWMALEWVDGVPLSIDLAWRRGAGGRTPPEAIALLAPIAEALAEAHARGIVHRDVKPSNMMIPASDAPLGLRGAPAMRLFDFGIAKVMAQGEGPASGNTATQSALTAFSAQYASPEQVSGMRTGPWTDVHALGLIFTEVLTDQAPYSDANKLALTMQVVSPTRPTPARFGVDVGAWEPVLARALALQPAERFSSAGEFLAALESSLTAAERPAPLVAASPALEPSSVPEPSPAPEPSPVPEPSPALEPSLVRVPSLAPTETEAPAAASRSRLQRWALAATLVAVAFATIVATYNLGPKPPSRHTADLPSPPTPAAAPSTPPPSPRAPPALAAPVTQRLAIVPATTGAAAHEPQSARSNTRPPTSSATPPTRPPHRVPVAARGASLHDRPDLE